MIMAEYSGQVRSYFQILIRLQNLHTQLNEWLNRGEDWQPTVDDIDNLLAYLQGMAVSARAWGLVGFTSMCLHVCERIEPCRRSGHMPRSMLDMLDVWISYCERYLRRPQSPAHARLLVDQLNDRHWGTRLDPAEEARLLCELVEPAL